MIIFLNSANAPANPLVLATCVQTRIAGVMRKRTAKTPQASQAGARPTPQPTDARYTITWEYTGAPDGPHAVLRFCGVWCSQHITAADALDAATLHNTQRTTHPEDYRP